MGTDTIEVIARAVVRRGSMVLLAQPTGSSWFFLPGGHVEFGEPAATALRRELIEELGLTDAAVGDLLAVTETRYRDSRGDHHEVNLVFDVVAPQVAARSQESHIQFRWVEESELAALEIRPAPVARLLRAGLDGPRLRVLDEGFDAPAPASEPQ
jgi:ADP-ribose pyrophosphatase YjhB (NUDIX family)